MDRETAKRRQDDLTPATLNKPVVALAIVPVNRSLTVTARKAYNVMLHLAQREGDTGDGGFSAPLNSILRGFGSGNNISTDAKRYIDQMMSTKIEWRPLSEGEQWLLPLEEAGTASGQVPMLDGPSDELRCFNMLSEVRLYKRAGENWVTWFYPPTIREHMLGPNRWARLELAVIARLSTYASVALYEICARYRDNPAGVTAKNPCDWWVQVLKGSEGSKHREWRKFKNEFVNPAIKEINEVSDIEVDLLEFKLGRAISDVQFSVRKKPASAMPNKPEPPDVANLLRASRLGIREPDAEALLDRYGEDAFSAGLTAMERHLAANKQNPIVSRGAYLKAILNDAERKHAGSPPTLASASGLQPIERTLRNAVAGQRAAPIVAAQPPATSANELENRNIAALRRHFEGLTPDEQSAWTLRLAEHAVGRGFATPNVMRRLHAGQWQSPLVTSMLLRFFAETTFGADWATKELESILTTAGQTHPT